MAAITSSIYCDDNWLVLDAHRRVGPFSSHWAACAAMIRISQPGFTSIGGDKPEDLKIEANMRELGVFEK